MIKTFKVIVPSYSDLSLDMQVETGQRHPVHILVDGRPLHQRIIESYAAGGDAFEFIFVLPPQAPGLNMPKDMPVRSRDLRMQSSSSIGETVAHALQELQQGDGIIVHMGDTLLGFAQPPKQDTVFVENRNDLYRWTSISRQPAGDLKILGDRDQHAPAGERQVCVGVFVFADGALFSSLLRQALALQSKGMDPFFIALEQYAAETTMNLVAPHQWYDFGHLDTYQQSRMRQQNLRHFNELHYDPERNVITKRSRHVDAFRHQVRWYRQIPDELACYLPRVYESNDGAQPYISMEFLSIPTLSELMVGVRLETGAWNDVARKLAHILTKLEQYGFNSPLAAAMASQVYVEKTRQRLGEYLAQETAVPQAWVDVAGVRVTLDFVLGHLQDYANKHALTSLTRLTPIHGDLCFSNVLYDRRVRHVKLIDPRGEFAVPGIYGDPRYDKAKLLHSYRGGYDDIVADRFEVELAVDGQIRFMPDHDRQSRERIGSIFSEQLFSGPQELREAHAIEALLFLSMLPLHVDKPRRQLAMLYIGLQRFGQLFMDSP
ncbi:hypothetical protein B9Z47_09625 [Limnohabitans sp. 2KL-1]|nr:hypothetical protein B9Z47_09625 [Limnohabitans sp. 2KL-1]